MDGLAGRLGEEDIKARGGGTGEWLWRWRGSLGRGNWGDRLRGLGGGEGVDKCSELCDGVGDGVEAGEESVSSGGGEGGQSVVERRGRG